MSKVRSLIELCDLRVSVISYMAPKVTLQCKRCQRFGHAAKLRLRTPVRRVWWLPPFRWLFYPAGTSSVLWLRSKPHGELQGPCEV